MFQRLAAIAAVCIAVCSHSTDAVRADELGVGNSCLCDDLVASFDAPATDCVGSSIKLITATENPYLDEKTAVITLSGPITASMDEEIVGLSDRVTGFDTVILDLDSPGGRLDYTVDLIAALKALRASASLRTYVRHGSKCLSACALVFQQGDERIAGGSSSWLFHGACPAFSNLPLAKETDRFIDLMVAAGASEGFFDWLVERGYLSLPGGFWLSGYELFNVHKANVITGLLDPWRPLKPPLP